MYFLSIRVKRDYWDATANLRELPANQTKFEKVSSPREVARTTNSTYVPARDILLVLNQGDCNRDKTVPLHHAPRHDRVEIEPHIFLILGI
jgi:hypothetical protein